VERRERTLARVFSFDIGFTGTRKTLFYRKLFGYSSSTKRNKKDGTTKIYTHIAQGLLGAMPHLKLGKSVIAVPKTAAPRFEEFFSDPKWHPIELYSFDAILPPELRARAMEEALAGYMVLGRERVKITTEMDELLSIARQRKLTPEFAERARRILRVVEEFIALDWTDGQEFSRRIEPYLIQLRKVI
jgi:hypothetical protein